MTKFGWMVLNMINSGINSMHPSCLANDTAAFVNIIKNLHV